MDVWIVDPETGEPLSVIDAYVEVEWTRRLFEAHDFRLSMEVQDLEATEIEEGRYLWVQDAHAAHGHGHLFIIESVNVDTAANTPPVEVVGRDAVASYFPHRVIIPPDLSSHLTFEGPIESALHFYVDQTVGPSAGTRAIPNLSMGTDEERGDDVDLAARFDRLDEFLAAVAKPRGIGWEILWDLTTRTFEFVAVVGEDRTETVIIDPEFETADEIKWLRSIIDSKSVAIVAGQGEGADRTVVTIWVGDEPTGRDRREVFIDARDTDDVAVLTERGLEAIGEAQETDSFEVAINPGGSFRYPDHFDLGDTVTIRSAAFGLQASSQIVAVTQAVRSEGGGGTTTTIQVGQVWPTLRRRVRQMTDRPTATGRA